MRKQPSISKLKREVLARMEAPPPKRGVIAEMSKPRLAEFQRDIVAKIMTRKEVADKYGMSVARVGQYRDQFLRPAMIAAQQNENLEAQRSAQKALWWLYDEAKETIGDLRGKNIDQEGLPVAADPEKLGNVEKLLGRAHDVVRSIGEFTGELKKESASAGDGPPGIRQVIKVISIPKVEGTPAFAMSIEQGPDYDHMNLIDLEPETVEA